MPHRFPPLATDPTPARVHRLHRLPTPAAGRTAWPAAALLVPVLAAWLAGCGPKPVADSAAGAATAAASGAAPASGASAPGAAASAPPVSVTLVRAQQRDFTVSLEASGTVAPLSTVDVKPQVSAQVLQVHVKEGQFVKAGQPLFTLDARADQANLKKAEAQLAKDEAALADARRQLARSQELVRQNFISQGAVDTNMATVEGQQAVIAADKAAIDAVKVQLSYSRITAPGAGRVGVINVFPGSSVSPTGAALLTITQLDPVAVSFALPQRNLPDALKALASGNGKVVAVLPDAVQPAAGAASGAGGGGAGGGGAGGGGAGGAGRPASAPGMASPPAPGAGAMTAAAAPAAASAASGAASGAGRGAGAPGVPPVVTRTGKLSFVDSNVDALSGTVKVKASFDNKDNALWPGAYVTVRLAVQTIPGAIIVPQASIVQGARGTAVFVSDKDGKAAIRPIKLLAQAGTDAVVSGVRPGEKVVLDGRQNVRPGVTLIERAPEGGRGASGAGGAGGGGRGASGPDGTASGGSPGGSSAPAGERAASAGARAS